MLLLSSFGVQAELYRSVDHEGVVQYSDLPMANADTQAVHLGKLTPQTNLPYATKLAMKKNPVTLYVAEGCGEGCVLGRTLLIKRGVPFTEKMLITQEDVDALKKAMGSSGVPALSVGNVWEKGFLAEAWQRALDDAGYSKYAPYVMQPAAPINTDKSIHR
jgi:hypothetical protein